MAEANPIYQSIWQNVIQPDQERRARNLVAWSWRWRKIQNWFEGFSRLFVLAATILSFASGVYENTVLAFVAGVTGATSIGFNQFSIYAGKESSERKSDLIHLLQEIKTMQLEHPVEINEEV